MTETMSVSKMLPPPLIHDLRSRSAERLFRMRGSPGNRGFGRYVRKQITAMVAREKTLAEKAITVAYMGSFLVDHIVQAEQLASRMIEGLEMTEAEEHHVWELRYDEVINRVLSELSDGDAIRPVLMRLEAYSHIPARLHGFRNRHWRALERWRVASGTSASRLAMLHLARVIASRRATGAKSRSLLLTASLLADVECWLEHVPWPDAYRHVMTDLYVDIARHPDVLATLV